MKNRRSFIKKSSIGIFGASLLSPFYNTSAKSYSRILGSNDRVTLAFQGLGRRFPGLLNSSLKMQNVKVSKIKENEMYNYFFSFYKKNLYVKSKMYVGLNSFLKKTLTGF